MEINQIPVTPKTPSFPLNPILVGISILSTLLTIFLIYQNHLLSQKLQQLTQSQNLDVTANWKTYSSTQYGYEFKYPSDLKVYNETEGFVNLTYIPVCDPLVKSCLFFSEEIFRGTNFKGAGFGVSLLLSTTSKTCLPDQFQSDLGEKKINGYTYHIYSRGSAAAGNQASDLIYLIYTNNVCYQIINRITTDSSDINTPPGTFETFTKDQKLALDKLFDEIISSFKFIPILESEIVTSSFDLVSINTSNWRIYTDDRHLYNLSYPPTWFFQSPTVQNYDPEKVDRFTNKSVVDWTSFIGNKDAIKIDIDVLDDIITISEHQKDLITNNNQIGKDVQIGSFSSTIYRPKDLGPGPAIDMVIIDLSIRENLHIYFNIWGFKLQNNNLPKSPDWNTIIKILSTFKFTNEDIVSCSLPNFEPISRQNISQLKIKLAPILTSGALQKIISLSSTNKYNCSDKFISEHDLCKAFPNQMAVGYEIGYDRSEGSVLTKQTAEKILTDYAKGKGSFSFLSQNDSHCQLSYLSSNTKDIITLELHNQLSGIQIVPIIGSQM